MASTSAGSADEYEQPDVEMETEPEMMQVDPRESDSPQSDRTSDDSYEPQKAGRTDSVRANIAAKKRSGATKGQSSPGKHQPSTPRGRPRGSNAGVGSSRGSAGRAPSRGRGGRGSSRGGGRSRGTPNRAASNRTDQAGSSQMAVNEAPAIFRPPHPMRGTIPEHVYKELETEAIRTFLLEPIITDLPNFAVEYLTEEDLTDEDFRRSGIVRNGGRLSMILDEAPLPLCSTLCMLNVPMPPFFHKFDITSLLPQELNPFFPAKNKSDAEMFGTLLEHVLLKAPVNAYDPLPDFVCHTLPIPQRVHEVISAFRGYGAIIFKDEFDPSEVVRTMTTRLSSEATIILNNQYIIDPKTKEPKLLSPKKQIITSSKIREQMEEAEKTFNDLFGILQRHVTSNDPEITTEEWKNFRDQWFYITKLIKFVMSQSYIRMAEATRTKFAWGDMTKARFFILVHGWSSYMRQGEFFRTFTQLVGADVNPKFMESVHCLITKYECCIPLLAHVYAMESFERLKFFYEPLCTEAELRVLIEDGFRQENQYKNGLDCERCGLTFSTANLFDLHYDFHGLREYCKICMHNFYHLPSLYMHVLVKHPEQFLTYDVHPYRRETL